MSRLVTCPLVAAVASFALLGFFTDIALGQSEIWHARVSTVFGSQRPIHLAVDLRGDNPTIYLGASPHLHLIRDDEGVPVVDDGDLWPFGGRDTNDYWVVSSPAISWLSDRVYVVTIRLQDRSAQWGLAAVDLQREEETGHFSAGAVSRPLAPAVWADGTIYLVTGEALVELTGGAASTGKKKPLDGLNIYASPCIGLDGGIHLAASGSLGGGVWKINRETFGLQWGCGIERLCSPMALDSEGTVYVGSEDGKLHAIDSGGSKEWSVRIADEALRCSPAIGSDGTVYVGSDDNRLYAINPDGTLKGNSWPFETGGDVRGSPTVASDGTVYVGSDDGKLYAIDPDGTLKEGWPCALGEESDIYSYKVRSSPVVFEGTLYAVSTKYAGATVYGVVVYAIECDSQGLADSAWPMDRADTYRTGRVQWEAVYGELFRDTSDLARMRRYRDKFLVRESPSGRRYMRLLYRHSGAALKVLLENPDLRARARDLMEANAPAVQKVLQGDRATIKNTDEVVSFLAAYAEKSPPKLKRLANKVKTDMLEKRKEQQPFLGFELK